jgi:transposase
MGHSPEIRERAVRMVLGHEREHTRHRRRSARVQQRSAAHWRHCPTGRQAQRDQGRRQGVTSDERERLKALER